MPSPDPPEDADESAGSVGGSIEQLRATDEDPNQWEVIVAGKVVVTLPRNAIEDLELYESMPWTESISADVAAWQRRDAVRRSALERLGRRSYSHRELTERLVEQGHDGGDAKTVVDELADMGWLDERLHAISVARRVFERSPCSRSMLIKRVVQKSVDREQAEHAADEVMADQGDGDVAESIARSMVHQAHQHFRTPSAATLRRRVGSALARRGFDEDTIRAVLDVCGLGEEHPES